jgi:hypothetical protein
MWRGWVLDIVGVPDVATRRIAIDQWTLFDLARTTFRLAGFRIQSALEGRGHEPSFESIESDRGVIGGAVGWPGPQLPYRVPRLRFVST